LCWFDVRVSQSLRCFPQSHSKLRKAGSLGSSLTLGSEQTAEAPRPSATAVATTSPPVSAPKVEPSSTAEQAAEEEPGLAEVQKRSTRSRPVDQIDPATGRIVKRWSSGNEAATTLEVSCKLSTWESA
jgi:hypothetical protein